MVPTRSACNRPGASLTILYFARLIDNERDLHLSLQLADERTMTPRGDTQDIILKVWQDWYRTFQEAHSDVSI